MPRFALITGASSGIGLALAEALARRGQALILVARKRDALESIACELAQRFGVEVLFRICDLSEPLQLSGLLHELEQSGRQIDLLVNNAGVGTSGPFIDQDWAREQELMELNVLALARLCHGIGARMMERSGGGRILNVASMASLPARPLDEQLLRQQGLRAALLRRVARGAQRAAASRFPCSALAQPARRSSATPTCTWASSTMASGSCRPRKSRCSR